jgi:hypothetical protein
MEEHPDCEPRCAIAVNGGDDDDGQGNKDLEGKRIDNSTPPKKIKSLVIYHLTFVIYHFVDPRLLRSNDKRKI